MKNLFLFALVLFCSAVEAKGVGHGRVNMSKLFKSLDDHYHNQLGLTTELDVYRATGYITPIFSITTPSKFNAFVSSQNLLAWGQSAQNYEGDTFIGASKFFTLNNYFALIAGMQAGYSLISGTKYFQTFDYLDLRIRPLKWLIFHGGPYYVNQALSTTYSYVGVQTGVEFNFPMYKLNFDYIGGHSNVSGATATLTNKWSQYFNSYLGVGVPETKSGNEFYGIIGINFNMDI
jgi:hypothetical protein